LHYLVERPFLHWRDRRMSVSSSTAEPATVWRSAATCG